jgi:hypothetical protein
MGVRTGRTSTPCRWYVAALLTVVVLAGLMAPVAPAGAATGVGVTAKKVKVGIALVNYDCIKTFTDSIRLHQNAVYQAFIDDLNAKGGVNGRKIEPVYADYCPLGSAPALAACTKLTDDDKVFAVMGTMIDFSGDAQACVSNQHHTVLMSYNLTQVIMDKAPPGLMIYPGATDERRVRVMLDLLQQQHTLKGHKIAVLGGNNEAAMVHRVIVPGLKKAHVPMGSTAVLSIDPTGDLTAAQAQLDSFLEKWKGEHVDALFLSGDVVSSKAFVTKIRQKLPHTLLLVDTQDVKDAAHQITASGEKDNPYDGILTAGGVTGAEYAKSKNWKHCTAIYRKQTGKHAPGPLEVVPGPDGKTLDTYGAITDACQITTMFRDIAARAGKDLNTKSWLASVNHYGHIVPLSSGQFGSLGKGKYDADDDFRLVAWDSSIGAGGEWHAITPVRNLTG